MANRFLDTNYYKSSFVRGLKGPLKSLYSFIICDCEASGIWNMDLEAATLYTGFQITHEEFCEYFILTKKAIHIGGGKFFFPDFIEHQHPKGLSYNNVANKKIISTLKKYGLLNDDLAVIREAPSKPLQSPFKASIEGLSSPIGKGKGNGSGIGNGQGNGKEGYGEPNQPPPEFHSKTLLGQMSDLWVVTFPAYTKDPERDLPALKCIADFIFGQGKVQNGYTDPEQHIKCLNTFQLIADQVNREDFWANKSLKSISTHIQEFYNKIKNPISNGSGKSNGRTGKLDSNIIKEKLSDRIRERQQGGN